MSHKLSKQNRFQAPQNSLNAHAISRAFSRAVQSYDGAATTQFSSAEALIENLPDSKFSRAIDIGCGTGSVSKHLLNSRNIETLHLLDPSPAMLAHAQRSTAEHSVHCHSLRIEDALSDDVFAQPFDLIFSNFALQWADDLAHCLTALCQRLSATGRLAISLPIQPSLEALSQCAEDHGIPLRLNALPTFSALQPTLESLQNNHGVRWQVSTYDAHATDLYAAIKTLKATGATAQTANASRLNIQQLKRANQTNAIDYQWHVLHLYR